ncbi:MAG: ribonuclease J [Oligoflexia bacterium]|nr:ribonuclease J [Oligoflexia bacterium]
MNLKQIKIIPIGGVGEIGQNMTLIKMPSENIIIDAGIMFPSDQFYNLQYLIPDLSIIDANTTTSLFVTHAHEDHIGGIPFLKKRIPNLKIYSSAFAREIIKIKLANRIIDTDVFPEIEPETNLDESAKTPFIGTFYSEHDFILIRDDSHFSFKEFDIYPIRVNHSIPETYGFLIQDKNKIFSLFFTSDCKVDFNNNQNNQCNTTAIDEYGQSFDFDRLKKLSQNSLRKFLFLDSTNIAFEGKALSERDLISPIEEIIINENNKNEKERGRIFITFFPSNIYRTQTLINLALKHNRKLIFYGKSLKQYAAKAHSCGYLKDLNLVLIDESELKSMRSSDTFKRLELIVLLTGCQGDLKGALNRVVSGSDPLFKLYPGDLLLFSSRTIPGNEKRLYKIYNKIYEQGAKIITASEKNIHASGHGGLTDIQTIVENFDPTDLIPIHGETYYLYKHIEFINKNFPLIKTHIILNYDQLTLNLSEIAPATSSNILLHIEKGTPANPIFLLDNGVAIEKTTLNIRRKMAFNGVIFVSIMAPSPLRVEVSLLGLPLFMNEYIELLKQQVIQVCLKTQFPLNDKDNGKDRNKDMDMDKEDDTLQSFIDPFKEILRAVLRKHFKKFFETPPVMEFHVVIER